MIGLYGAFGFLIITIEWKVCLRNDFTDVILTYVDTVQPIFRKIRKIIKELLGDNAPVGGPIISKLSGS